MTTAPAADQRRLLDVQALDTQLAKLAHQRKSHPTLATLAELEGRAEDLGRAKTATDTLVSDVRRELRKAEADVEQVEIRAARDRKRLESGAGSPKDLQALSSEIESLARRQGALEEVELEVMERLEAAEKDAAAIDEQLAAISAQVEKAEAERDREFERLDSEIADVTRRREVAAAGIDAGLMSLYDRVRSQTGGLGVVAIQGESTVGVQLTLSLTERAAITAAGPDEVIRSEDYGYILVRLA
ncbi:hypothetical protein IM660_10735 [Ruania alkalisoli]|uniref:CT398-like coiled coil hairpin domain-containing protein n=1 Tax=Ruania alkalisoli TaxID=2779775 RepID=A0A7M1SNR2_9MICO|nr:hypothetical protein [Ruania alkalisoli]QOR69199.1 hypothetical protein IM660_10735 [Ruania alkalisoli]